MKIVLAAINAKYIHSNLAVRSLMQSTGKYEQQIKLLEFTINHTMDDIFAGIYREKPDIIFFSCYIWNRREVRDTASSLHKVLPDIPIWAGGPEPSYDAVHFLTENPFFSGVMIGEGEPVFPQVLRYYVDKTGDLSDIPGIMYRDEQGELQRTMQAEPAKDLDALPFVYEDLAPFENRILYYESSRGCPFSCSYCLSSIDKRVRFRSMELVKRELNHFLRHQVKQVKFVDRTFNCSHSRTIEIWQYLLEHDNGVTNFHFEISADLLNDEEIALLGKMRPGLVQLEIGVQTVNDKALEAIHRTAPFAKIADHVTKIKAFHNIMQHLDLIAGLPYEDMESFRTSFDTVYALHPEELQLGFLKVLRGSEMYLRAEEYGILYRSTPPYEVLATRWISCDELLRLKEIEEMLEVYYNSRQFVHTMLAAQQLFARPVELYEALADYYAEEQLTGRAHARLQRFEILHDFLKKRVEAVCGDLTAGEEPHGEKQPLCEKRHREELLPYEEAMLLDLYLRENAKSRPAWAPDLSPYKEEIIRFYQKEEKERHYLPEYTGYSWKQMMHMTHLERMHGEKGSEDETYWLLFDYSRRDPLTSDARVVKIGTLRDSSHQGE